MIYSELVAELEKRRCPKCGGLGVYNDAEPGDIYYNTYECHQCKGTGWIDGAECNLVEIEPKKVST